MMRKSLQETSNVLRRQAVYLSQKLQALRHFDPALPGKLESNGNYVFRGIGNGDRDTSRKEYLDNALSKGLEPLGTRHSIRAHVTHISDHSAPPEEKTSYIAFTRSLPVAKQFAGRNGYVVASSLSEIIVTIDQLELGTDMMLGLASDGEALAAKYKEEQEVSSAVPVSPNNIVALRQVGLFGSWQGECLLNKNYHPNNFSIHILSKDQEEHAHLAAMNQHLLPVGFRYVTYPEAEIFATALREAAKEYDREKIINSEFHFHIDAMPQNAGRDYIINQVTELFHEQMNSHGIEKTPRMYLSNLT